jgi:hypothetical protein
MLRLLPVELVVLVVALYAVCVSPGNGYVVEQSGEGNGDATLRLINATRSAATGAVCLDGSRPGYYLRTVPGSVDWLIFFQGGGWCLSVDDCAHRSRTIQGSSSQMKPSINMTGIMSSDAFANPRFAAFNVAYLQYCDGASFAGNADEPVVATDGTKVFFRGKRVLDALFEDIMLTTTLPKARRVLLSGSSAGGLATYLHADYVGGKLLPASVSVYKAAASAGFFLRHPAVDGRSPFHTDLDKVYTFQNVSGSMHPECLAALLPRGGHESRCFFAQDVYPVIKTPFFVVNSVLDQYQMKCILTSHGSPFKCELFPEWHKCTQDLDACSAWQVRTFQDYSDTMLAHMRSSPTFHKNGNGAFLVPCLVHSMLYHTDAMTQLFSGGKSLGDAVGDWFGIDDKDAASDDGHGDQNNRHYYLPCILNSEPPYMCNPSCLKVSFATMDSSALPTGQLEGYYPHTSESALE